MDSSGKDPIEEKILEITSLDLPQLNYQLGLLLKERSDANNDLGDLEYAQAFPAPDQLSQSRIWKEIATLVYKKNSQAMNEIISAYNASNDLEEYRGVKPLRGKGQLMELSKDITRMSQALEFIKFAGLHNDDAFFKTYLVFQTILGDMLFHRGTLSQDPNDLETARALVEEVIEASSSSDENYWPFVERYLFIVYRMNLRQMGEYEAATDALELVKLLTGELPERVLSFAKPLARKNIYNDLKPGEQARENYVSHREIDQLNLALASFQKAPIKSFDNDYEATRLYRIGECYGFRYEALMAKTDYSEALRFLKDSLAKIPTRDTDFRVGCLRTLAGTLSSQKDDTDCLEESIQFLKEAIELANCRHPALSEIYSQYGFAQCRLYSLKGRIEGLERALSNVKKGLELASNESKRKKCLSHMSTIYHERFQLSGSNHDLTMAIQKAEDAAALSNEAVIIDGDRGRFFNNLATLYESKYIRQRLNEDLIESIEIGRKALEVTPLSHGALRRNVLFSLGRRYLWLSSQSKELSDVDAAEKATQEALELMPPNSEDRLLAPSKLASITFGRWALERSELTLHRALDLAKKAQNPWVEGCILWYSAREKQDYRDILKVCDLFLEQARKPLAAAVERMRRTRASMILLQATEPQDEGLRRQWLKKLNEFAEIAIKLMPVACSRDLSRDDQQRSLQEVEGLAADGCALSLRNKNTEQALQRLEYGRGLVLGHVIDGKDNLNQLRELHPEYAKRYEDLHGKASEERVDNGSKLLEPDLQDQRNAKIELERLEEKIQRIPGFENFQKPFSIQEKQNTAAEGPIVVVNITDVSSDAILITQNSVDVVSLPKMNTKLPNFLQIALENHRGSPEDLLSDDFSSRTIRSQRFYPADTEVLSWLWHQCVLPILKKLDFSEVEEGRELPRLWWIRSGAASSLPLHAAEDFGQQAVQQDRKIPRTCLDCVISSYTPTIKALEHSRRNASKFHRSKKPSLLFVTMENTPGQLSLSGVKKEKMKVQKAVADSYEFTWLESPDAQQVLTQLKHTQIAHFACHGQSDPASPWGSHLLLKKVNNSGQEVVDDLSVRSILDATTAGEAWIVYLSACSTADVKVQTFVDENLHLAGAFQAAGFAHAIGSLWSADDNTAAQLAGHFYQHLVEDYDASGHKMVVSQALRKAIMDVRKLNDQKPAQWAAFVHYGA